MLTLPGHPGDTIISCNYYDAAGSPVVDLFDNPILGWLVDETTAVVSPLLVGSLPPKASGSTSPQWASLAADDIYVPDTWRGTASDFFTWLATNAGAGGRKVRGNFRDSGLSYAMQSWAQQNPTLFNPAPF